MKTLFAFLAIAASAAASAQTVGNDGSLNHTYAFSLPEARGKFQPSLALNYNSGRGATSFGVGWELGVSYVDSSTRTVLDNLGNVRTRYTLVNDGGARRLVQLTDGTFRADTSPSYLAVSRTASGWLATDGMGVQYTYACIGSSSCDRWYLTQVADLDGNRTVFNYVTEAQSCTVPGMIASARLTGIHYDYNGTTALAVPVHDVILTYSVSADQAEEAIGHCMVLHDSVLTKVAIYRSTPSQTFVGAWDLSYSPSPDTHRSRLDSIQAKDRTDTAFEAPATFVYETDVSPGPVMAQFDTPGVSFTVTFSDPRLATFTGNQCLNWGDCSNQLTVEDAAVFMDMDGDGKPDLVWGGIDGPTTRCPTCTNTGVLKGIRWARNLTTGNGTPVFAPVAIIPGSDLWSGFISTANVDGSETSGHLPDIKLFGGIHIPSKSPLAPTFLPVFVNDTDDLGTQSLVMDFDGDGAPDLISVGCGGNSNALSVFFSRADSTTGQRIFAPAVCVDASAPAAKMLASYRLNLSLQYTSIDGATNVCEGRPTFTWVTLGDFNGDGIADFIVADSAGWHVYLGYKLAGVNTGWAFTAEAQSITTHPQTPYTSASAGNIFPIRAVLARASLSILGSDTCATIPLDYFIGGRVTVDFRDMNGDGLPDRVLAATTTDANGTHMSWLVDYNTGTEFTRIATHFGLGIFELNSPIFERWVGTPDTAMVDLNRDGRPDLIARSSVSSDTGIVRSTLQGSLDNLRLWFNSAAGLRVTTSPEMVVNNPTGKNTFHPYSTLSTPPDAESQPPPVFNEGFYDFDGDGIIDYVRALRPTESSVPTWIFHRGKHQQRRSDILQSMTTPLGLTRSYVWAPSSAYDSRPGIPYVSDVVSSMTQTGIAMAPLTVAYSYATLQSVPASDDPTGSHQEALGFLQQTQTPSVGGLVTQTTFGSKHEISGVPVATCMGTAALPCGATSSPGQIERQETIWLTASAGTCTGAGCQNPVFVYADLQRHSRPDLGVPSSLCIAGDLRTSGAVSCQRNNPPDAFGNIGSFTKVGDAFSASATTMFVTRFFATNATSKCPSCMTEEVVTGSGSTNELAHTYYHFDQSPARTNQTIPFGHTTSVEWLVSGNGTGGVYEAPQTIFFTPSGNVDRIVRSYTGTHATISSTTEQMTYDSTGYNLIKRALSDNLANELDTTYAYDAFGNLTQINGPSVPGSTVPTPVLARGYDNANRVVVESDQPIVNGNVSSALRAFVYLQPAAAQDRPLTVQTYSYAVRKAFTLPASPPSDGDTILGQQFVDSLGRTIETMSSFGSNIAATAGSNVIKVSSGNKVTSVVMLDGLGRTVASFEPFFNPNPLFVDPQRNGTSSGTNVHATAVGYDAQSRPVCTVYEPVTGGVVPPAPGSSDPSLCASNYTDGASYRRATRLSYGVSSAFDSRPYLTIDTVDSYATGSGAAATPARAYLDVLGRPHYSSTPAGTYVQETYDALGRVSSLLRYPGAPPSSSPVINNSWTYDKRGRVLTDFSDSRGYLFYSYLPTGEAVQQVQNPNSVQANVQQSVSSDFFIGTLGRIVERKDGRWEKGQDCTWSQKIDDTQFQYDRAFNGPGSQGQVWYGYTAGHLSAILNSTAASGAVASIALGYDNLGNLTKRDEWIGTSTDLHSVSAVVGPDGRLLSRTMVSTYLNGYNPAGRFGYNVGYDSSGNPAQVSVAYDSSGAAQALVANDPAAYWVAGQGAGGTDPTTGPFDAFGRLSAETLDGGKLSRQHGYSQFSNLPSGFSTTLLGNFVNTNVYTVSQMTWQGALLRGQTVASNWDGTLGTSHAASYDLDGHLASWSATPMGTKGAGSSQFNEQFNFKLENLNTVKTTNSIGATVTSTYNYDPASPERVLSTTTGAPVGDFYGYDIRGRGLVTQHKLTATQTPAQDAYEYDSVGRLISIAHLGVTQEQLGYDGAGDLVSRTFAPGGAETARYYIGDDLTLVAGATAKVGYAHIRVGNRVASFWASITQTTGGGTIPPPTDPNPPPGNAGIGPQAALRTSVFTPSFIPPGHPPPTTTTTASGVVYYHRDRRGDVVATTAKGGVMGVSYRYLPSGQIDKVLDANGNSLVAGSEDPTLASELGFTSGLKLSGGLIHLKARVYSPTLRRFLQADTVDVRRYTYGAGDPLNMIDPSGRKPEDPARTIDNNPGSVQPPPPPPEPKPPDDSCEGNPLCEVIPAVPPSGPPDPGTPPPPPPPPPQAPPVFWADKFAQVYVQTFDYHRRTTHDVLSSTKIGDHSLDKIVTGLISADRAQKALGVATIGEGVQALIGVIVNGTAAEVGVATLGVGGTIASAAVGLVGAFAAPFALETGIVIGSSFAALGEATAAVLW